MKTRIRTGIKTIRGLACTFERCNKHGKVWKEGVEFEKNGGNACEECISKSRPTKYV